MSKGAVIKSTIKLIFFLLLFHSSKSAYAVDPPFILPEQSKLNKLKSAVLKTDKGTLLFELYPEDSPWHVANFKYIADKGLFRNRYFTIFYPGYILQGGDTMINLGYSLPPEFSKRRHEKGMLGMARKIDIVNPERRSDPLQFYVVAGRATNMDANYTIFGRLVEGFEVLRNLRKGDRILDVVVYVRN